MTKGFDPAIHGGVCESFDPFPKTSVLLGMARFAALLIAKLWREIRHCKLRRD